jgi:pilus assembly protein Flp/PilA
MSSSKKKNQRGAVAIEYGLIAALMVLVMIPAVQSLGGNTNSMYNQIQTKIAAAMAR